jgi:glycosyltransferase involved in cell wall biosynthesis
MIKKPTITVGIPAYNEEKNIINLISSIKRQNTNTYILDNIEIYSDGSTDSTVDLIKSHFSDVTVHDFKKNLGKNARINQMLMRNLSDVFIQIDADIKLENENVFDHLVSTIISSNDIGIVCAYHRAKDSTSFIGKLAFFGFTVWDTARTMLGVNGIRYYCEGGLRAFSYKFTKSFQLPLHSHVGEDSYSFYVAVSHNFRVTVSKQAIVYIDLPDTYSDYIKQMKRFLLDPGMVNQFFEKKLVQQYETMTTIVKLKALSKMFTKHPLIGICYVLLQLITKFQMLFYKAPNHWKPIDRK